AACHRCGRSARRRPKRGAQTPQNARGGNEEGGQDDQPAVQLCLLGSLLRPSHDYTRGIAMGRGCTHLDQPFLPLVSDSSAAIRPASTRTLSTPDRCSGPAPSSSSSSASSRCSVPM